MAPIRCRRHGLMILATAFVNVDIVTGKRWARDASQAANTSSLAWQNGTSASSTESATSSNLATTSTSETSSSTTFSTSMSSSSRQSSATTSTASSPTSTSHITTSVSSAANDTALPTAPWFSIATSEYNITSIMMTKPLPSSEWSSYQYTGDCWDQWSQYWSPSVFAVALSTSTGTKTNSFETRNGTTFTSSVNGAPYTQTYAGTTESYYLDPGPYTELATVQTGNTPITTPGCVLPTSVSQCQSQWSSWLNASMALRGDLDSVSNPMPSCTQASVGSELCTSLAMVVLEDDPAQTAINWGHKTISPWPSNSQLAPGCTLGCQQCSITGNTIRLFYWPPATANVSGISGAPQTYGNVSEQNTAVINGTTFTSPTIYISYDTLYASDSCSQVGSAYSNLVVPLTATDQMSSLVFRYGYFTASSGWSTRPFHVSDLVPPVPHSIYNLQPECMKQYEILTDEAGQLRGLTPEEFACNAGPYRPIIAVPPEVSALDPEWNSCLPWYGGLYDPPEALQPTAVEATPTRPATLTTTSASPSPTLTITSATATTASTSSTLGFSDPALGPNSQDTSVYHSPAIASTATSLAVGYSPAVASSAISLASNDPSDPAATSVASSLDPDVGGMASEDPPSSNKATLAASTPSTSLDAGGSVLSILQHATQTYQDPGSVPSTTANVGDVVASVLGMQNSQSSLSTTQGSGKGAGDPGTQGGQQASSQGSQSTLFSFEPLDPIGGAKFSQDPSSHYVIGSQTLLPGGPAITVSGTVLSLAPSASAIVINDHTTPITQAAPSPPGSSSVTKLMIMGSTLAPGSSMVVQGTTYSLPSAGGAVYVNGVPTSVSIPSNGLPVTIGSVVMTPTIVALATKASVGQLTLGADPLDYSLTGSAVIFGTQTLTPGAQITASGQTLSLQTSGVLVVNGSITRTLTSSAPAVMTIGSNVFSYSQSSNAIIIGSRTLSAGGQVTISGETISLQQSDVIVVNGSITKTLAQSTTSLPAVLTLSDKTVAITRSGSAIVVGSQVLDPGSTAVVDGVTLSLPIGNTRPVTVTGSTRTSGTQGASRTSAAAAGTSSGTRTSSADSRAILCARTWQWELFTIVLFLQGVMLII